MKKFTFYFNRSLLKIISSDPCKTEEEAVQILLVRAKHSQQNVEDYSFKVEEEVTTSTVTEYKIVPSNIYVAEKV